MERVLHFAAQLGFDRRGAFSDNSSRVNWPVISVTASSRHAERTLCPPPQTHTHTRQYVFVGGSVGFPQFYRADTGRNRGPSEAVNCRPAAGTQPEV